MIIWDMDKADAEFSIFIRRRDGRCMNPRCPDQERDIKKLECSHFYPRNILLTRFDPENCFALCHWCHAAWENTKGFTYAAVMMQWLGEKKMMAMVARVEKYKYQNIPYISKSDAIAGCREFLTNHEKR